MFIISAPDDHFTASPHCRVKSRAAGALVVLVGVQLSCWDYICRRCSNSGCRQSAPDDHFTASPDRRVRISAAGALVVLVR